MNKSKSLLVQFNTLYYMELDLNWSALWVLSRLNVGKGKGMKKPVRNFQNILFKTPRK
jgi:hypothetical protein